MSTSALLEIRRKEIELQTRLLEARQQAEALVADARLQAEALRRTGAADAEAEARRLRALELERTDGEVVSLRREFGLRCQALASSSERLGHLAQRVVAAVAPSSGLVEG